MLKEAQVKSLARLARLALREDELPALAHQLSGIFELIERMNAVDTEGVEPLAHPVEPSPRRRADEITEHDQREAFAAVAPSVAGGYYLVPRVIE